ncbi:MAG TPA: cytochrome c3 family protein [Dissulfurispiraceae bacterium]|nr:cytochrome c3 family protein [Dissulfurispiraceae bacterium]
MRRLLAIAFLWFLLVSLAGPASADTFTCLACHSAMKGKIRTDGNVLIDVNVDSEKYESSVHGGFDCIICHKQFQSNPHEATKIGNVSQNIAALAGKLSPKAKVDPVALAACTECHSEVYKDWQESVHGNNIIDKRQADGADCLDCHGSPHYITPKNTLSSMVNRKNVVKTCGDCHENEHLAKKYNLGSSIIERYYESFHGKKYALGHPTVPTCVSCHKSHAIKKWDDPASPVAWENRTVTCGNCHPGATRKFVAAITHKPYGKDNPIPYYFQKGLILLLFGVFAFIVSHVFLEVFSEIRDKVFRKEKEEHHE